MTEMSLNEFKIFFDKNYIRLRDYIYYRCGYDIHLAEDLAQDTLLRIWEKRDKIQLDTLLSYAYAIARNVIK